MRAPLCGLSIAIAFASVIASTASANAQGRATRPDHALTTATDARPFISRWRPGERGDSTAAQVASTARTAARQTAAALLAVSDSTTTAVAVVHDARADVGPSTVPFLEHRGTLRAPVDRPRIAASFGSRPRQSSATLDRHSGVSYRAAPGEPVYAVASGVVVYSGEIPGFGHVLIVAHGDDIHTVYARLIETSLRRGDRVAEGAPIGGGGGQTSWGTNETYFEVRVEGVPVDPANWLR